MRIMAIDATHHTMYARLPMSTLTSTIPSDPTADFATYLTKVRLRAPRTVGNYSRVARMLVADLGAEGAVQASVKDLQAFLSASDASDVIRSRVRYNQKLSAIRGFCAWAIDAGLRHDNPALSLHRLSVPFREAGTLSLAELVRLVEAAERSPPLYRARNVALIQALVHTGLRVSEIAGLNVYQVDLDEHRLTGVVRKGGKLFSAACNNVLVEALRAWLVERHQLEPADGEHALWLSDRGTRLAVRTIQQLVHELAANAGIRHRVSPHTLRHASASQLSALGVPVKVIQDVCGHASLATTQRYLHATGQDRQDAADRLGHAFRALRESRAPPPSVA